MSTAEQDYQDRLEDFTNRFLTEFFDGLVGREDVVGFLKEEQDEDFISDLFEQIETTLDTMIQRQLDR